MINKLAAEIHENNKKQGFYEGEKNIGEMLCLIHSEVSEALEADRKGRYMFPQVDNLLVEKNKHEEWKTVEELPDYEVSSMGNIRSLDMKVWNGKIYYAKQGRLLSSGLSKTGYLTVSLKGNTKKVHRLVAKHFVDGYFGGAIVNHINGVKTDNFSNNLEWVSYSENNDQCVKNWFEETI